MQDKNFPKIIISEQFHWNFRPFSIKFPLISEIISDVKLLNSLNFRAENRKFTKEICHFAMKLIISALKYQISEWKIPNSLWN